MKNFIAAGLLAIIAIAGTSVYMHNNQQATNDVNLMLYYKPGGTYDRLNKTVIAPAIGDRFNKTVAIKGCASLKAYWDKTDEKMFGIWDVIENSVPQENGDANPCAMPSENVVGILMSQPFYACHKKGAEGRDLNDFLNNPDITIGVNGYSYYKAMADDVLDLANPGAKVIPYSSSKLYLPALQSGEIDYLYSVQTRDTMTCIATTDKTDASNMPQFWRMGKMSNSLFANKGLNPMLVFKNMTVEEAQQLYRQVLDSDEYKNVIEKQYRRHELADSDVSTQLDFLKTYQQHLVNVMR